MERITPMHPTIGIGNRRELFVDHHLVDRMENARLTLHEPVSGGTAIGIDRPWEDLEIGHWRSSSTMVAILCVTVA